MATETPATHKQPLALSSGLSATKLAQAINSVSEPSVKAALCRAQVHSRFPTLSPDEIANYLKSTARTHPDQPYAQLVPIQKQRFPVIRRAPEK